MGVQIPSQEWALLMGIMSGFSHMPPALFPVALMSGFLHMLLTSIPTDRPQEQSNVTLNFSHEKSRPVMRPVISILWPLVIKACCGCADNSVNVVNTSYFLSAKGSRRWFRCSQREIPGAREWPPDISQCLSAVAEKQVSLTLVHSIVLFCVYCEL